MSNKIDEELLSDCCEKSVVRMDIFVSLANSLDAIESEKYFIYVCDRYHGGCGCPCGVHELEQDKG